MFLGYDMQKKRESTFWACVKRKSTNVTNDKMRKYTQKYFHSLFIFTAVSRADTVLLFHFWFGFGRFSQESVISIFPVSVFT